MKVEIKKIFSILNHKERKDLIILLFFLFIGAFLEMVGIGIIIPLLSILTGEEFDFFINSKNFSSFLSSFGVDSLNEILLFFLAILLFFYFLKTLFLSYSIWFQAKFLSNLYANISNTLFKKYLNQDYLFHVKRNSSKLIQNIVVDVSNFTEVYLFAFVSFFAEIFIVLGLSLILIVIEPLGFSIVLILFGSIAGVYLFYTRKFLKIWGSERKIKQTSSIQHIQQGLSAIKDLKVLGLESKFSNYLKKQNDIFADLGKKWTFIKTVPKNILEFIALAALVALITVLLGYGRSTESVLITVGVFSAAAFKIIPSIHRLVGAFQVMRFSLVSLETVNQDLKLNSGEHMNQKTNSNKIVLNKNICVKDLSFIYPGGKKNIFNNLNLTIPANKTIGITGESGSGKTTFIDLILGVIKPTKGNILADDIDINLSLRAWQNIIGYIPQSIYLGDDTVKRNIALGIDDSEISNDKINYALENSESKSFINSLPNKINETIGERGERLSGGQRQRLGIARALYNNPKILVMDEATNALDSNTEMEIIKSLNSMRGKKTIFICAHNKAVLDECDLILTVQNGKILNTR